MAATASWTPAANASTTTWSKNQALTDLQAQATQYNASSVTYDSATTYYNGYNPNLYTPEGEAPATWTEAE